MKRGIPIPDFFRKWKIGVEKNFRNSIPRQIPYDFVYIWNLKKLNSTETEQIGDYQGLGVRNGEMLVKG